MKTYELLDNVEIQVTIHFCYYDYEAEKRIEITEKEADNKEIRYIYTEDNELYIEVDFEN